MNKKKKLISKIKKLEVKKDPVLNMAKTIFKMVQIQNKKIISEWIDGKFDQKLNETVEKFVQEEFKNEVLPVLIDRIDKKIESLRMVIKKQTTESIKEVLIDILEKLEEEQG